MANLALDALLRRISDSGLLDDPVAEDDVVYGRARLDGAGADVMVNVDPELEEVDEPDSEILLAAVARILGMSEAQWTKIVEAVATEIEEAVADSGPIEEQTDLRADIDPKSVVVFADAVMLSLAAPRQFPDSRILVQLDEDFEIEDVQVIDDEGSETIEFDSLDDLLDHISGPGER
ncbi:cytochrome C5 [Microbacterium sp. CFH 90308]|uniref:Cytochrome C5 n=1 Tax=Microbacterium salsuginis TaxID=2722803 RepID=A0ABX1KEK1_9MICO|nr:cytochrome C5 [Microbacterium sp. CFH 90308]NLP84922.1 cytochrome C5 [Microbacterium sp. CFH 90308]